MCTAAAFQTKDFYFGRTLDYECSYGECVTVTPRRYPFSFRHMGRLDAHYAMIGMAHVADGYPLYYDAVNEAGLGMAGLNFVGNVEANTALLGGADVIVADGYSGNILLKTVEGAAKLLLGEMKKAFLSSTKSKLGALLVKDSLGDVKKLLDPSEVGGTPFLGISKPVLKAHGSSDARAIRNAVFRAVEYAQSGIIADVEAHIDVMKVEKNG